MRNTFDLLNFDTIQTPEDLVSAVQATFDPDLPVSPEFVYSVRIRLKDIARAMGCLEEVCGLINEYSQNFKHNDYQNKIAQLCTTNRRGDILCTTDNFVAIMANDPVYSELRLNELSMRRETVENGKVRLWSDTDDSVSRAYIEKEYGIHSVQKHGDALSCLFSSRKYHPIKQAIESIEWDGESRIPQFLSRWMGAEDSEYTREVSRLIFAGGIQRLYNPGCKFEDMAVLIGKQGGGKSSFIRFLAIEDRFFKELKTIEGKEGIEGIEGAWIVEVSELLALTKTKEQEAVKAYLSCQTDFYRPAYGHHTIERPRTCAFIGTSNRAQFITDKTGGRRFYPVHCHTNGYDLFDRETECREYIKQCWAEALAKIHTNFMAPYARREIKPVIETMQENATEEDYRIGMIQSWLDREAPEEVCGGMIWEEALQMDLARFSKTDQTQLGLIMNNSIIGWEKCKPGQMKSFLKYGRQRFWKKKKEEDTGPTYDEPNDSVPF